MPWVRSTIAAAVLLASSTVFLHAQAQSFSAEDLTRRTVERRAVEAAIWGMPIVSVDAMRQGFFSLGARYGDIAYFSRPADWKFQVTTPNASSLYVYLNYNVTDGPVVLEFPAAVGAGLFGTFNDAWQVPLVEVGPTGDDQGKGGKYLIVPPGFQGEPPAGYLPVRSPTYNGYAIFRAIPVTRSEEDTAKALALVKQLRLYPLAQAANPPPQQHIDIAGKLFDGIAELDDGFFDRLVKMVNEEPVQARDLVAMGQLRSLGIEKGKPFRPDAATRAILKKAAREAQASFMTAAAHINPYWASAQWGTPSFLASGAHTGFSYETKDVLSIDDRGAMFFLACAPPKKLGAATFYLSATRDAANAALDGGKSYHLRIPPDVPARQFWAVTVYDLETAGFFREAPSVEVNSYQNLQKNADGSIDVFFGPKAPAGKEGSWIFTAPGKSWMASFRFYGPEKAVFDKTWTLPDVEEVQGSQAQARPHPVIPVTPDNFNRAETDVYFAGLVKTGAFGKFVHIRDLKGPEEPIVRPNRDTLYSGGVFDLDAGPVTVSLPDAGGRYMSLQVIDEDAYTPEVVYGPGSFTFEKGGSGTRYVALVIRTLVDPNDAADVRKVHALQDAIRFTQAGTGTFEVPNWDPVSQKKVRDALLALNTTLSDTRNMFGSRDRVDPVRHLIGTAMGFGGNPEKDALYLPITPRKNDGAVVYQLTVRDVPVDGFWSITVYNAEGHLQPNPRGAYSLNNITAKKAADGSVAVQFGGCDGAIPNCLPTVPGWNYLVRLYRPRTEVLNGAWTFPEARPTTGATSAAE